MKPVTMTSQQYEDVLSIQNNLSLALMAHEHERFELVPTALEDAFFKLQELIGENCVDKVKGQKV